MVRGTGLEPVSEDWQPSILAASRTQHEMEYRFHRKGSNRLYIVNYFFTKSETFLGRRFTVNLNPGAPGRIRTYTEPILSRLPLPVGLRAQWCPRRDSNPHANALVPKT